MLHWLMVGNGEWMDGGTEEGSGMGTVFHGYNIHVVA